jgi:LysR family transcriptional regulator, transcriptional activator of nhaA
LETWFREQHLQPRIVAEFEDLALMKVMAAEGRGFIALPSAAVKDAVGHYGYKAIGRTEKCRVQFHAITAERRIAHPAVALITGQARVMMKD